ncbi:MAG: GIY-YIG nuclease family protein [Candidatus Bathyarchaeota archaeon]|nr:GIY-YIG nuclease family protein [Candidatus Bathyarchaeota archaeon]
MKLERSDVDHPLWRKKVDSSLFRQNGTTIPHWACRMWEIQNDFSECTSRTNPNSTVEAEFKGKHYKGWVTIAKEGRKTPAYRLWYAPSLSFELKDAFVMSFARDIEARLRKTKKSSEKGIEEEIPFWEFLDIEYQREEKRFYFRAYYTQKPVFTELFKHLIESPVLHKIDDELKEKPPFRIYKTKWRPRSELEFELGANNVLYFLIDTKNKLLYVGEAARLIERLRQEHPSIPNWDYFRYNVLPDELFNHRVTLERMLIRDYASLINNTSVESIGISDFKLVNDKIDV